LAELPNAQKIYVANRGSGVAPVNGSVQSINAVDGSVMPIANSTWNSPVWVVARHDNARAYALDQGTGLVSVIDTSADAVVGTASVQPGANFILYDSGLSRLYVTNPVAKTLTVFNASSDTLPVIGTVSFAASSLACPNGCTPLSVAALPDGSRVYVASYQTSGACTQSTDTAPCVTAEVTVIHAPNLSVTKSIPVTLATAAGTKTDTPELAVCDAARFRISMAAAADSTRAYMSYCDAGSTAVIRTTPNTSPGSENAEDYLVNNLPAPSGASPAPGIGDQPPPQNPVFVLAGP
jgi:DNA-binding beta-propeller fold protein YncE